MTSCIRILSALLFLSFSSFAATPDWVESKPVIPSQYVGIGVATKDQYASKEEWIKAAEARALANISEAISVTIEATSKVSTTASDAKIQSLVQENLKTITSANLEGYQFVDSWEDRKEYWVYYKLDKSVWAAIEQRRCADAVSRAQNYLDNADQLWADGSLTASLKSTILAYNELIPVLHLSPTFKKQGIPTPAASFVDNTLNNRLNLLAFNAKSPLYRGSISSYGQITPKVVLNSSNGPCSGFPVLIGNTSSTTDATGKIAIGVQYISADQKTIGDHILRITTDTKLFTPDSKYAYICSSWILSHSWPSTDLLISFTKPSVYVQLDEASYSELPISELKSSIHQKLSTEGYEIAEYPENAEMRISVSCSPRTGGSMGNLYFSFVDIGWKVYNAEGDLLTEEVLPPVKDGALNHDDALLKAMRKGAVVLSDHISLWIKAK